MKKLTIFLVLVLSALSLFGQNIQITPVDFNSGYDDFGAFMTQNGKTIFFSTDRDGGQKVFFVKRMDGGWELQGEIDGQVNNSQQSGSCTITPDGQYMIFAATEHASGGEGRTDLYSARKVKGEWTDIRNLGPAVNSGYWDSQPALSSDGNTLYFVSDRPGGYGGTDIYMSKRSYEGWSKAVNLSGINSESDEMSPLVAVDNQTFTFASNKAGGIGGFDIYFAKVNDQNFSSIKNAGTPINSPADDMFYFVVANSKTAYLTSNRNNSSALDIFTAIPNPHTSGAVVNVQGIVTDAVTGDPLDCEIIITDLKTKQKVALLHSDDEDGSYFVVLQPGRNYSITANKKGYVFYSERFNIPENEKGSDKIKDIKLYPLSNGNTRLLLFFDFDKATLQDESIPELDRLISFLDSNPDIKIRLEGHTDDVGDNDYNMKLSLDRANAAKDYIVKGGIEKSRIKTVGYGETRPLINDTSEEARSQNRRVELIIDN